MTDPILTEEEFARLDATGTLPFGWMSARECAILARLSAATSDASRRWQLEVGSYKGRSTYALAQAGGPICCVDTFHYIGEQQQGNYPDPNFTNEFFETFRDNMTRLGVRDSVVALVGRSELILPRLRDRQFRLALIDAGHDYDSVKSDLLNVLTLVEPGGTIVMDDYRDFEGVRRVCEELRDKVSEWLLPEGTKLAIGGKL